MITKEQMLDHLDRPSSLRAGNATIRECLIRASKAVTNRDWETAIDYYSSIEQLASSLRSSAERNAEVQG